jgi:hypothetical protein
MHTAPPFVLSSLRPFVLSYRHALLLVAALLFAPGCSDGLLFEAPPVPDSTMVELLTELHVAKARRSLRVEERRAAPPPDSLLRRHHLDRAAFERALDYYADHPKAYAAIYDSVVERLSRQRDSLREQSPTDP